MSHTSLKTVTTTDLRNIAIGLAAAIALIVIAGQIADSDSASVSALEEKSESRFANPTIGIISVASDNYINEDESDTNGWSVIGSSTNAVNQCDDEAGDDCIVTVTLGGVSKTVAVTATSGSWTATFASGALAAVSDGTYQVTADVTNDDGAATQATAFAVLDTADPTVSETTAVSTPNKDSTPDVIITSNEAGDLSYTTCTFDSATASTIAASTATTLTLDADGDGTGLGDASYANCKIRVTDDAGNIGSVTLTTFVIDTTVATPSETTVVTTPTKDTTPDVVITTAEAGTIVVAGTSGCGVGSANVVSGQQTVTLSASGGDKAYTCTVTFTDSAGNAAGALTLTAFTLDTTVATPSETTVVTTPTKDTTPDVVITTSEAGSIAVGGTAGCGVGSASVSSGQQTVTLSASGGDKAYTCTVTFTDSAGNAANALTLTAFTLDTTANTPSETTAVSTPTNDETPDVVITTDEAGTIVVGGTTGCGIGSASVVSGQQTLTLSEITQGDGAYTCTITFTDALGNEANALTLTAFTLDNAVATPSETTVVTTPTKDTTPDVVITTTQAGTIAVGGTSGCGVGSANVISGQQTVTLSASGGDKAYTCTITFTDSAGNTASALTLTAFTLDTTVATPSETTAVTTPTKDTSPDVVITTAEAGTIVVAGTTGCGVGSANVASGQQTITLSTITQGDGAYTCTITFTDAAGNAANALTMTAFTLDTTVATPSETTVVTTPTKDTTPDVVITTAEAGTIAVGGTAGCGVGSSSVSSGQQTVTLSASSTDKAYTCTITFTDAAGNVANALTLTAFTLDTTVATPSETTVVTTPTKDTTPSVVITTAEAGTIVVGGTTGCAVGSANVVSGQQTITYSTITQGDGTYTCTMTFTDAVGNAASALTLTAFVLDTTVATPSETTAVSTPTNDETPDVVITTAEAGTIVVAGTTGCGVASAAVSSGEQTITLSEITQGDGAYTCTITFTDAAGNAANALTLTAFTLDNAVATPSETTVVTTPTKDTTPDVVITTTQAGTIAVGGTAGCGVGSSAVSSGQQTVTLSASGGDKAYTCTITFTDSAGNTAAALTLTAFTLDTTVATPSETTVVTTPTKDTTPRCRSNNIRSRYNRSWWNSRLWCWFC
ncbi:MAG: beta strand repeat-containing protein [Candidatus Thalassarchaeaceae archaeon]